MFFGAIGHFERVLLRTNADPKTLIISLRHVLFMGITGLLTLAEVIGKMQKRGVWVLLCEPNNRILDKLRKAGLLVMLAPAACSPTFRDALTSFAPYKS